MLFLSLFLFGFFFPLSSLLFWVPCCCCFCLLCYLGSGLPSLLFAHGSNKSTVFPLSIWETDFTCAKILLSYNAVVLTSILKSCQLILAYTQQLCSIWPAEIIRAKIWRIDITWRILPSCITALPTIAKHLINGFHCTFIFDLKSGNLECSWCRAKVDTLLFGSYHPWSLYTCIILPLAMASCTFPAFLVSAYERGFHVFNHWCFHPLDLIFVHLHFIQCLSGSNFLTCVLAIVCQIQLSYFVTFWP